MPQKSYAQVSFGEYNGKPNTQIGLWKKDITGWSMMTGRVTFTPEVMEQIGGRQVSIAIFKVKEKKSEKGPDYNMLLSYDDESVVEQDEDF